MARLVAAKLNFPLYDTDEIFLQQYKITIQAFVKTTGWLNFRRVENGIVMDLFSSLPKNAVVSLGGGVLAHDIDRYLRELNTQRVTEKSQVIYLIPSPSLEESARILTVRELRSLEDPSRPPLPQTDTRAQSLYDQTLRLITQRHPFYLSASKGFVVYENDETEREQEAVIKRADLVMAEMAALLRK
jgi:shikimate kinase